MFPVRVLNKLRLAQQLEAEMVPTLMDHKAWVLIRPQIDPDKVEWDRINHRWVRVYIDEDILAGFKVNHIEIEARQLEDFFSDRIDIDITPSINERFYVTSEEELVALISRWVSDFSAFQANAGLITPFAL